MMNNAAELMCYGENEAYENYEEYESYEAYEEGIEGYEEEAYEEEEAERAVSGKGTTKESNTNSRHLEDSVSLYLSNINKIPLLSAEEECALGKQLKEGGEGAEQARKALVQANLRLVYHIAKSYCGRGVELEDLNAMGIEGLIRATEGFDYTLGFRFSTYASSWIKQAIHRGIVNEANTVRIPSHMKENIYKVRKAREMLMQEFGKEPKVSELVERCGLSEQVVLKAIRSMYTMVSLDANVGEDGETTMGELVPDVKAENPEQAALNKNLKEMIQDVLGELDSREARVLELRYGIDSEYPMSLEEIAKLPEFNITRERVRQIETRALHKIRTSPRMMNRLRNFAA